MDKWLLEGQNKNKEDNAKFKRKRESGVQVSEALTSSTEANAVPSSSLTSVGSMTKTDLEINVRKAELKLAGTLAE
ncbi:unnamed protein product [Euphydryas editha]|uniref:Uncharacterized protein n=1 Tax=Euphydryas editha TaxID=104508 RepID=A0AAU9UAI4_EUPED|nr:unnamed protein product [Euphydryas editha]